jgi:hypothetical protein
MNSIGSFKILNNNIKIQISHKDLSAVQHLVNIAPQEAQWFHRLEVIKTNNETIYRIYDLYIPEQYCSLAEVESTSSMMINFYRELISNNTIESTNSILSSLNVWCHSHHTMSPNPSGQDNNQFLQLIKYAVDSNNIVPQIMLIFNKNNQYYSRIFDPSTGLVYENVSICVETEDLSWINKEAAAKFKKPTPKNLFTQNTNTNNRLGFPQNASIDNSYIAINREIPDLSYKEDARSSKKKDQTKSNTTASLTSKKVNSEFLAYWKLHSLDEENIILLMKKVFSTNSSCQKEAGELEDIILKRVGNENNYCALLNLIQVQDDDEDLREWEKYKFDYDQSEILTNSERFYEALTSGCLDDILLTHTIFLVNCLYSDKYEKEEDREKLIDWWLAETGTANYKFGEHF